MASLRQTLDLVERELSRSARVLRDPSPDTEVREELVRRLLDERQDRLEQRLRETAVPLEERLRGSGATPGALQQHLRAERLQGTPSPHASDACSATPDRRSDAQEQRTGEKRPPPRPRQKPAAKAPPKPKPKPTPNPAQARARSASAERFAPRPRIEAWQVRQQQSQLKLDQARAEQERRELAQCTFHPRINSKSDLYASRLRAGRTEPLVDRLHHEADERERVRQTARELLVEQEVAGLSFRPQIKERQSSEHLRPIHERLGEIASKRRERLNLKRVEQELQEDLTFVPRIDNRSDELVQQARERAVKVLSARVDPASLDQASVLAPVEERLLAYGRRKGEEREQREHPQDAEISTLERPGHLSDFLQRQDEFVTRRDTRRRLRERVQETQHTFTPALAPRTELLVETNQRLLGETQTDRCERLAVHDAQRRQDLRAELETVQYAECTFHPKTCSEAAFERADRDVFERLAKDTAAVSRPVDERPLDPECTFQPKVTPQASKFAHVKPHYEYRAPDLVHRITQEEQTKLQKRAEGQRALDARDLKECTFRPSPAPRPVVAQGPVVVRGLDRFLELRLLAKKQQEGKEERPKPVQRAGHVTIPEPFALSSGRKGRSASTDSRYGTPRRSFQPRTVEAARRDWVQDMLAQEQL